MAQEQNIPRTGPKAILHALQQLDLAHMEEQAKEDLKSGKKTKRPKAVAILSAIAGMKKNNLTPSDFMVETVPVIPHQFRPYSVMGSTFIPGDANVLYGEVIEAKNAHNEEKDMFGEENSGPSLLNMYDSVRAVYGYGDPVKEKTRQKEVKGFLSTLTGSTSKYGFVNRKLLSKPQDNTGRSTIVVDPELGIDELGMPREMAFTVFAPHVQRTLRQMGYSATDSIKLWKDRTDAAQKALHRLLPNHPAVYARAPAWYGPSILSGYVKLRDGEALAINPYVTTGLGADFNGDSIAGDCTITFKINGLIRTLTIRQFSEIITGLSEEEMIKEAMHFTRIYKLRDGVATLSLTSTGKLEWMPVSQITVHTSHGQCFEVCTHTAKIVPATEHHNFAFLNDALELETRKTEDIVEGMWLPAAYNFGQSTEEVILAAPGKNGGMRDIVLDRNLAWLLGFFAAEGSTGGGAVTFCCTEEEYFGQCRELMYEYFGTDTKLQDTKLHKQCIFREYRKALIEWFSTVCGHRFDDKFVPACIWNATVDLKIAYIQGVIDGDGNIDDKKNTVGVRIELNNRPFIEQLCGLAASIGIRTYTPRTPAAHLLRFCAKDLQRLITPNWTGRKVDRLRNELANLRTQDARDRHDIIPVPDSIMELFKHANTLLIHPDKRYKAALAAHRTGLQGKKAFLADDFKRKVGCIGREKAMDYVWTFDFTLKDNPLYIRWKNMVLDVDVQWERVKSVTPIARPDVTYDVTVPGTELFTTHGNLLVHNTINVHAPATARAIEEAKSIMLPSYTPFSNREEGSIVPAPKQEAVLSFYTANKRPADNVHVFATEEDALKAIRSGKVPLHDEVEVTGGIKSAGAVQRPSTLEEKHPVKHTMTGKFMPTVRKVNEGKRVQPSGDDPQSSETNEN